MTRVLDILSETQSYRLHKKRAEAVRSGPPSVGLSEATDPPASLANTSSPLDRLKSRTHDMAGLRVNVMREVRRVPDRYVLVVGALSVDEAADISRSVRLRWPCLTWGSRYSVVYLRIVMPQDPHVTASEGVCGTVVWTRDQQISITGRGVLDPPPSTA